jgi:hypothetical protein
MIWKTRRILSIIIVLAGAVLCLVEGSKEFIHAKQLAARGETVQGEVTNLDAVRVGRRSHYYLRVKFHGKNQDPIEVRVETTRAFFDSTHEGDTVPLRYLPEDPTICQIVGAAEWRYADIAWGVVLLCVAGYLVMTLRRPSDETEIAKRIGETAKTLALDHYEYTSVKAEDFKNVDRAYYDAVQRDLESHGFVYLDDQENVTLRERSGVRTFLRHMLGPDQATMAIIYHFVRFTKSAKVLDLETWFSDGSFVCTSNAESAGKLDTPPAINALRLSYETTWEALLETHQRRVSAFLESHRGTTPVKLNGMADIRRAQAEQQRIKSEFRKGVGISKAELERIGGGSSPEIERIHDELTRRRERGE